MNKQIVEINQINYNKYDLFCKKSQKKKPGYKNKVSWIEKRFKEGLKIQLLWIDAGNNRMTSRGFIEYIPGEYCWRGINAQNYLVIHCIWVTGKYKNHGYGNELLNLCIDDAKNQGKLGVAVVVSEKHWLPKSDLFEKNAFEKVDEFPPLSIWIKKFDKNAENPSFNLKSSENPLKNLSSANLEDPLKEGITIYHANQCPYIFNLVNQVHELADELKIPFSEVIISNRKQVLACPHPYGVCAIFYKKKFLSYSYEKNSKYIKLIKEIDKKE